MNNGNNLLEFFMGKENADHLVCDDDNRASIRSRCVWCDWPLDGRDVPVY